MLTVGMGDIGQLGLGPDVEEKTRVALVPGLPDNIVAVSAGGLHTICLDDTGKVWTTGHHPRRQWMNYRCMVRFGK